VARGTGADHARQRDYFCDDKFFALMRFICRANKERKQK
jgi:hypothetical protein